MASETKYQKSPPAGLTRPGYSPSPLKGIAQTGQGRLSKPVPPKQITLRNGPLKPAPKPVGAPGAAGTI